MRFEPFIFQEAAIRRIIEQPATGLFLDLGMGKTVITMTAIDQLIYDYCEVERVLVIAPLRVAEDTWSREAAKWDHLKHLRISKVLGAAAQRVAALQAVADIYVINRENVEWLVKLFGRANWPFDMVVIDELSSFKSPEAKRFRKLRTVRPLIKRIVGLTGTPAPNGLIDLWAQLYLLDRGERLGHTVGEYRATYFNPGRRNRDIVYEWALKPGADKQIHAAISDICVSMAAKDWLELPKRIDRVVPVQLPREALDAYAVMEREMILSLPEGDVVAGDAAAVAGKLLQMANGAVYDENHAVQAVHAAKLQALGDIIEAANGEPVLVAYAFKHDQQRIVAYLQELGIPVRALAGSQDIEDWNAGRIPVLLAHPASAGYGLNLQAGGNTIVWYGLTWSLEQYLQFNGRLHRQGQQRAVIIHHLVAQGTVDEDVMRVLGGKEKSQAALLLALKARIRKVKGEAA